jgi:hypothetical protein
LIFVELSTTAASRPVVTIITLLLPPLLLLLSASNNYRPNCVGGVVGDGVRSRSTRRAAFAILLYNVKTQRTRHTNARAAPTAITVAIPVFSHPPTTTSHVSQVLLHTIGYSPRSLQQRRICRTGKRRIAFQDEWGRLLSRLPATVLYYGEFDG